MITPEQLRRLQDQPGYVFTVAVTDEDQAADYTARIYAAARAVGLEGYRSLEGGGESSVGLRVHRWDADKLTVGCRCETQAQLDAFKAALINVARLVEVDPRDSAG